LLRLTTVFIGKLDQMVASVPISGDQVL